MTGRQRYSASSHPASDVVSNSDAFQVEATSRMASSAAWSSWSTYRRSIARPSMTRTNVVIARPFRPCTNSPCCSRTRRISEPGRQTLVVRLLKRKRDGHAAIEEWMVDPPRAVPEPEAVTTKLCAVSCPGPSSHVNSGLMAVTRALMSPKNRGSARPARIRWASRMPYCCHHCQNALIASPSDSLLRRARCRKGTSSGMPLGRIGYGWFRRAVLRSSYPLLTAV